jgi:hypothetical protein
MCSSQIGPVKGNHSEGSRIPGCREPWGKDVGLQYRFSSFKFLGIHITEDLTRTINTTTLVKRVKQCIYVLGG